MSPATTDVRFFRNSRQARQKRSTTVAFEQSSTDRLFLLLLSSSPSFLYRARRIYRPLALFSRVDFYPPAQKARRNDTMKIIPIDRPFRYGNDKTRAIFAKFPVYPNPTKPTQAVNKTVPYLRSTTNLEEVCLFLRSFNELMSSLNQRNDGFACLSILQFLTDDDASDSLRAAESQYAVVPVPANLGTLLSTVTEAAKNLADASPADRSTLQIAYATAQTNLEAVRDPYLQQVRTRFDNIYTSFVCSCMPIRTCESQKRYMLGLRSIPVGMSVRECYERILRIDKYLEVMRNAQDMLGPSFGDETLCTIVEQIVPRRWVEKAELSGLLSDDYGHSNLEHFFSKVENVERSQQRHMNRNLQRGGRSPQFGNRNYERNCGSSTRDNRPMFGNHYNRDRGSNYHRNSGQNPRNDSRTQNYRGNTNPRPHRNQSNNQFRRNNNRRSNNDRGRRGRGRAHATEANHDSSSVCFSPL